MGPRTSARLSHSAGDRQLATAEWNDADASGTDPFRETTKIDGDVERREIEQDPQESVSGQRARYTALGSGGERLARPGCHRLPGERPHENAGETADGLRGNVAARCHVVRGEQLQKFGGHAHQQAQRHDQGDRPDQARPAAAIRQQRCRQRKSDGQRTAGCWRARRFVRSVLTARSSRCHDTDSTHPRGGAAADRRAEGCRRSRRR